VATLRIVLDTNVLLAGLVSTRSASQMIVDALNARRFIPLISADVLAEYRRILAHPTVITRYPQLSSRTVAKVLHRLRYLGDEIKTSRVRFEFQRDPLDAKFIELAIAGDATHIITLDDDLLSLATLPAEAGKRFRQRLPHVEVRRPGDFVSEFERHFTR